MCFSKSTQKLPIFLQQLNLSSSHQVGNFCVFCHAYPSNRANPGSMPSSGGAAVAFLCLPSTASATLFFWSGVICWRQRIFKNAICKTLTYWILAVRGEGHGGPDREHNWPLPRPLCHGGHLPPEQVLHRPQAWSCLEIISFVPNVLKTYFVQ